MRDPERQNRFGSDFTVSYPDFPSFTQVPRSAILTQKAGTHDVLTLTYPRLSRAFSASFSTGIPVQMNWKNDKVSGSFVGYVYAVSASTVQTLERLVTVTCVGASFPLKQQETKIWTNKTASEIAADIAKKFKLKPVVTPHTMRFTQQSLGGHSYWEKLNELAAKIGYVVQVYGTELHFHPLDKMIDKHMTSIPVMAFLDPLTGPSASFNAQTLDAFTPKVGDYVEAMPNSRTEKNVSGIDPLTGKPFTSKASPSTTGKQVRKTTKSPLFSSVETRAVTGSAQMAKLTADAKAQLARFSIPAEGVGQGDPRVAPYHTIEVRGSGTGSDGFWVVTKAVHHLHRDGRYQVEFDCVTDGYGKNQTSATRPSSAGTVPTRNVTDTSSYKKTAPRLTSKTAMISQTKTGYNITPRRWES